MQAQHISRTISHEITIEITSQHVTTKTRNATAIIRNTRHQHNETRKGANRRGQEDTSRDSQ